MGGIIMKYEMPKCEIIELEIADVVTVSAEIGDGDHMDDF